MSKRTMIEIVACVAIAVAVIVLLRAGRSGGDTAVKVVSDTVTRTDTLRKLIISNPNNPEIKAQFARWIYAKGRPLQSLIDRRKWEADNFFKK